MPAASCPLWDVALLDQPAHCHAHNTMPHQHASLVKVATAHRFCCQLWVYQVAYSPARGSYPHDSLVLRFNGGDPLS